MNNCQRLAAIALPVLLAGCSWVGNTIRSELSTYAEPTSGDMAHIRLIGSRNVKVYPNSRCVSHTVPGSGYPAGPQMGGQRTRDIGMAKAVGLPRHYVEIAAVAGQPITIGFSFYIPSYTPGLAGTGAPGRHNASSCHVARSFVPEAGGNYEVIAHWWGHYYCNARLVRLERKTDTGPWLRVNVSSAAAGYCQGG
ncbi:MAG TPA: hypothetical protein VFF91_02370 [Pseudoxanthomonas sp.]|nr:hypothetical protein [Pseudoxanthomonas sp.]